MFNFSTKKWLVEIQALYKFKYLENYTLKLKCNTSVNLIADSLTVVLERQLSVSL